MPEITRLHLASIVVGGQRWPVHGFVVTYQSGSPGKGGPSGAILVDTGIGGPQDVLDDWGVVNRTVADALAEIDMSPADIGMVVNTHLHFDHCGQNAIFPHAPCYVQRAELERARREDPEVCEWFGFAGAKWELLDGDADLAPGVRVIATPGHTSGHQSVVVSAADGTPDIMIGDAAYTAVLFGEPPADADLPPGQAADPVAWRSSLGLIKGINGARVHFCHDTAIVHG
jgi:N-acyl homoserine lactone hydrolase